jgi:anti-sigma B factor antagonist
MTQYVKFHFYFKKRELIFLIQEEYFMLEVKNVGDEVFVVQVNIPEVHTLDVPDLKEKIQQIILNNNIKKLVLDLSKVRNITSSGIGIFLSMNESLKSNFRLACPSLEVARVMDLTKVSSILKIYDTVDKASRSF